MAHLSGSGQLVIYGSPTDVGGSQIVSNDLVSGHLTTASSAADGTPGNAPAYDAVVSANGRWVLFSSDATNLVSGITPGPNGTGPNLFRKDLSTGAISLAVTTSAPPNGSMSPGGISDDGNLVAFTSSASNLVGVVPDPSLRSSGYLRDLTSGAVRRLLYQPPGSPTPGSSNAQISADGKTAAFLAANGFGVSTDVVSCSVPTALDQAPTCTSVASAFPVFDVHLAASGTALEYSAAGTPESPSSWQVFRADLVGHSTGVASISTSGVVANANTGNSAGLQGISGDGSAVFFSSTATNVDSGATDGQLHAYLRIGPQPAPTATPTPALTPTPTPTVTPPTCGTAKFIGVRGSGEKESAFNGLGYTIQNVANTFAAEVPAAEISHVDYEAVEVGYQGVDYGFHYDTSVDSGRILLKARIQKYIRECAGKYIVLAGYSQGAHVVGDVFQELSSTERRRIAAVVLLGDPRFSHKQKHGVNVGDFGPFDGVYSIKQKPRSIVGTDVDRVRSFCAGGDPVCNSWPPNLASCLVNIPTRLCPHLQYVEWGWTDKAALWAATRLKSLL